MAKLGFESFEKNPEIECKSSSIVDWGRLSDSVSAMSCSASTVSNSLAQCQDIIDAYWGAGGGGGISISDKVATIEDRINALEKLVEKFSDKTVLRFSLKTLTGEWKNA